MRLIPSTLLLALTLLLACAPDKGGQVGEETTKCTAIETTNLTLQESTPLGFTAMEVLDLAQGSHSAELLWNDGTQTQLTAVFTYQGSASYQVREWISDATDDQEPTQEPAPDPEGCPDIVEVSMSLQLSTADGALNETWLVALQAPTGSASGFYQDLDTFEGSFTLDAFAPEGNYDSYQASLDFAVDAQGISGTIAGLAQQTEGDTVSAQIYDIASFGIRAP